MKKYILAKTSCLLLIAAGAGLAGCSQTKPPFQRYSVVEHRDPSDTTVASLGVPDTVRRGVPFTLTFITVYYPDICWKPDGETSTTSGRQTRILPSEEWVLPAGQAGPCDLERIGVRSTTVTLTSLGIDTIRVVGRVDPYSVANFDHVLDSVSATVIVLP